MTYLLFIIAGLVAAVLTLNKANQNKLKIINQQQEDYNYLIKAILTKVADKTAVTNTDKTAEIETEWHEKIEGHKLIKQRT